MGSVMYVPFPVCTQTKLCIISKCPIYANTPLRALCCSRPFLSCFLVGCLSLLLDTAELLGVHPLPHVLRSLLLCEGEQKWQAVLEGACCTFKVFGIVLMLLSALLHGGWCFCSHPRYCFCNCSNAVNLFTVLFLHRLGIRLGEGTNTGLLAVALLGETS